VAVGDTVTSTTTVNGELTVWMQSRVDAERVDEYGETVVTASTPLRWATLDRRPDRERTARPVKIGYETGRGDTEHEVKARDRSTSEELKSWNDIAAAEKRVDSSLRVSF
jgi:hypothetical protein